MVFGGDILELIIILKISGCKKYINEHVNNLWTRAYIYFMFSMGQKVFTAKGQ